MLWLKYQERHSFSEGEALPGNRLSFQLLHRLQQAAGVVAVSHTAALVDVQMSQLPGGVPLGQFKPVEFHQ